MKTELFNEMMGGFAEAIKYRRGEKANVRVYRFARPSKPLKPSDIRRIRTKLGFSQFVFAEYLGISVGTIRSWEQGVRRPQSAALHLLMIARQSPAVLLQREET
jgi:putative transcriptional regulator